MKINDVFGNVCEFTFHEHPSNDTIEFMKNHKRGKLTVLLIFKKNTSAFKDMISMLNLYAKLEDERIQGHELIGHHIVFVMAKKDNSKYLEFKKWFKAIEQKISSQ